MASEEGSWQKRVCCRELAGEAALQRDANEYLCNSNFT